MRHMLHGAEIGVVPVTAGMAVLAREAHRRRGRHPARLGLCNCVASASAKSLNQPLPFQGNDFPRTDIEPAPY